MKSNLFFLFIASTVLLVVCYTKKVDKSAISTVKNVEVFSSSFSFNNRGQEVAYFESEDFVSKALDNYSVSLLEQGNFRLLNCSKEVLVNIHDSNIIDTIFTFSDSNNKIQIYRAEKNDFIFTFDVIDSTFALNGDVRTYMAKKDFLKKFQITENLDNIVLTNEEGTMAFMFHFEHDILKRINSYLYLD